MPWGKLCDTLWMHPKVVEAGNEAVGAWVRMISYSCSQLTDGVIPAAIARTITTPSILRRLTSAKLLEQVETGWKVHDFSTYNPTRASVEESRAKTAARVAEHRQNKGNRNACNTVTDGVTNGVTNSVGNSVGTRVPSHPIPPHPVEDTQSTVGRSNPSGNPNSSSASADNSKAATEEQRKRKSDGDESPPPDVRRVFDHWRAETNHPKARLDAKRAALIRRRLGEYSSDDLMRAIDGYASSPWHRGENDRGIAYDGIDLILRDSTHIERGWEMADKRPASSQPVDPWVAAAARQGVIL